MRALGAFALAGGFTVGVRQAGFEVVGHLEDGPFGVATALANLGLKDRVWTDPENWPLEQVGAVDLLYTATPRVPKALDAAAAADPRLSGWHQTLGAFDAVKPTVWATEVPARVERRLIDDVAARGAADGYSCSFVPVGGGRAFLVLHRVCVPWAFAMVPTVDRRIDVSEVERAAVAFGYPPGYEFIGINAYEQIMKSVPPVLGGWLGACVAAGLEDNIPPAQPTTSVFEGQKPSRTAKVAKTVSLSDEVVAQLRKNEAAVVHAIADKVDRDIMAMAPVAPAQASLLPLWEQYPGPTAIARALIAEGHEDGPILATTKMAIKGAKAAGFAWPHLFTAADLRRLRARVAKC